MNISMMRGVGLICLLISVLSVGCEDNPPVQNQIKFDLSPCLGSPDETARDGVACTRSTIQDALDGEEPNVCIIIQQDDQTPIRLRARLNDGRLNGVGGGALALNGSQTTRVSLFFMQGELSERACRALSVGDECRGDCVLKLEDQLADGGSGTVFEVDFRTTGSGNEMCAYQWNLEVDRLAAERCDGVDNDCDGRIDEKAVDAQPEICDRKDNDCDGRIDEEPTDAQPELCDRKDNDCDGRIDEEIADLTPEVCDGLDNDCDGRIDENATDAEPEVCDSADNDCDGRIDEDFRNLPDNTCNGLDEDCDGNTDEDVPDEDEVCDGVDNDCDGETDENLNCCDDDADCESPTGACVDGQCEVCAPDRPLADNLCPSDMPVCRSGGRRPTCDVCAMATDCDSGQLCVSGQCVQCEVGTRNGCSAELPWCESIEDIPSCVSCTTNEQCGENAYCHLGQCVRCVPGVANHCPVDAPVCIAQGNAFTCSPCSPMVPCDGDLICRAGQCLVCTPDDQSRCTLDTPFCRATPTNALPFECSAECVSDNECATADPTKPLCVAGRCAACEPESNRGCIEAGLPVCKADDTGVLACSPCGDDTDCDGLGINRQICVTEGARSGECVECADGRGCAGNAYCIDHACSPCDPSDNQGCQGDTPRCAPRGENTSGYECRPCDPDVARDNNACTNGDVCVRLDDDATPTCQECDPSTNAGCVEDNLVCQRIGGSTRCIGCLGGTDDCTSGVYENRVCLPDPVRPDTNYQVCLECNVELAHSGCPADKPYCFEGVCEVCERSTSAGCLEDAPQCVDGACEVCNPTTSAGCLAAAPICGQTVDGIACQGCSAHRECAGISAENQARYCDFASGSCLTCASNENGLTPEGCPDNCSPENCPAERPYCIYGQDGCVVCDPGARTMERYTCDGDTPVCVDGNCQACDTDEQCQSRPGSTHNYCVNGRCEVCRPGSGSGCDSPTLKRCADNPLRCVECLEDRHCHSGTCDRESAQCICANDEDCRDLDRPLCVPDPDNQALGSRCQPCTRQDCQHERCLTAAVCQSCSGDGGFGQAPGGRELADGPSYGCDEKSATPICALGQCQRCEDDDDCRQRPGRRDYCRQGTGRCEYCPEGVNCSVRIKAMSRVLPAGMEYAEAYAGLRCGDEHADVIGSDALGQRVATVECLPGDILQICCSVGAACHPFDSLPQVVLDSPWTTSWFRITPDEPDPGYGRFQDVLRLHPTLKQARSEGAVSLIGDGSTQTEVLVECEMVRRP